MYRHTALHTFPVPREAEGIDLVDLATQAQDRFRGHVALTPLERSDVLSHGDNAVYIKRADLLPGGNFKSYTLGNTVAELREQGHETFVIPTAGSAGIGTGHAIERYGGSAIALMSAGANEEKQKLMRELGVEVMVVDEARNFDEVDEQARVLAEEAGYTYLSPFATVSNVAGAGILGLEVAAQAPDMTHVVTQYGGGSLHSGVAGVLGLVRSHVHKRVVQVHGCSPFVDSLREGTPQEAHDLSSHIIPSYFRKLGGVGVGRTHPLTLGLGSRAADSVGIVDLNSIYATMHEVSEELGELPEVAAGVGLEGARRLARSPGLEGAVIVAFFTGNHADPYRDGWLARKALARQHEEEYSRTRPQSAS